MAVRLSELGNTDGATDTIFCVTDFTVSDPHLEFSLSWDNGAMRIDFGAQQADSCYSVKLTAQGGHNIRFTSDDGVDADTRRGAVNGGTRTVETRSICSKWSQIYLTK